MTDGNGITRDIVAKLWTLCHVLRDDGITYKEYVTELTFCCSSRCWRRRGMKIALPKGYRWDELEKREGLDQLDYYRQLLLDLGKPKRQGSGGPGDFHRCSDQAP